MGTELPQKGHSPPIFGPCLLRPDGCMDQEFSMPLGMEVGLGPGDFVLDGNPAPQKRGTALQFSAHVCSGQTAPWMKMPLRTEVGLSPGNIVLDGDPAPPPKGHSPPVFGPCLLWPNGWMHQDTTWYEGKPQPRQHCVRWDPAPLP